MLGSRNTTGAISIPAIEPIAAAMPQPSAIIQEVLMPTSRADSGTAAAARIASPTRVYWKKKYRPVNSSRVMPIMPAWCVEISWLPRNGDDPNGVGYCLMVKSQISPATLLMMANSAMKPATLVRTGAFASGLNNSRSITMPPAKENASVSGNAHQYGMPHCINCQEMQGERLGETHHARLRRHVVRHERLPAVRAGGRDVHDAAPPGGDHVRQHH